MSKVETLTPIGLTTVHVTQSELALIGHVRGWCHNGADCALCDAQIRAYAAERALEKVISG